MDKKGQNNNIEKGKIEPAGFITSVETVKAYQMVSEIGHVRVFALLILTPVYGDYIADIYMSLNDIGNMKHITGFKIEKADNEAKLVSKLKEIAGAYSMMFLPVLVKHEEIIKMAAGKGDKNQGSCIDRVYIYKAANRILTGEDTCTSIKIK